MKKKFIAFLLTFAIIGNTFTVAFADESKNDATDNQLIFEDENTEVNEKNSDDKLEEDVITEDEVTDTTDSKKYGENVDSSIELNSEIEKFLNSDESIKRISGNDKFETSIEISKFENTSSDKVIIADARQYADALSGSSLTFGKYPILLVDTTIDSLIIDEIIRLKATEVIILGGENSVNFNIENTLNNIPSVEKVSRIFGEDRFDTSSLISKNTVNDNLVIASGEKFPDALAASILTNNNADLLLTSKSSIPSPIKNTLNDFNGTDISVVGGISTIFDTTLDNIKEITKKNNIPRISGSNKFETSVKIANFANTDNTVLIASGEKFPDALAASTLSKKINAPILLVSSNIIDDSVIDYIKNNNINKAIVLGGSNTISDNTFNNINRIINGEEVVDNTNPISFSGYIVSNGKQNVYSLGSYSSDIKGSIKDKQIVKVLDQNYSWVKINYDNLTGWVEKKVFSEYSYKTFGKVVNDVPYISQLKPVYAPNGCEPTSLLMGLQGKGYTNIGLREFLDKMPKSNSNPKYGYVGSPYNSVNHIFQTIDPEPLAKYGQQYGNVVNIQGSSTEDIIREVQNGNTVVVWVTLFWQNPYYRTLPIDGVNTSRIWNNHVLLVTGYNPDNDSFYIADPYNHEGAGANRDKSFYYWKNKSEVEYLYNYRKFAVAVR